ncbi:MAG: TlpA family protein disulfide reductase [Bacteroidetes bacterium]|nr:TlpA family protein disulfide reductase [Bacteroidota bacterium]
MNSVKTVLMISLLAFHFISKSQSLQMPPVDVLSLDGKTINSKELLAFDRPTVLVFWNCDDRNCLEFMKELSDTYENEWKGLTFRIIGICSNNNSSVESIRPMVNILGLAFDIYFDRNDNLKRALSVPDLPYTLLINPDTNLCYRFEGVDQDITDLLPSSAEKCYAGNRPGR